MTLKEFVDGAVARLGGIYDAGEARAIAFRLVEHFLEIPSYEYITEPQTAVTDEELMAALDELCTGRPLQYVLGFAEFCGHRFKVREGCLIPRPETEELVSRIIDSCSGIELGDEPFNILDICSGSGCIAYSLAAEFPEAMVYGCDVSEDALKIACKQRIKLSGARPVIFRADVLQAPPVGLPKFDVIVSNPPYVRESEKSSMRANVLDFEPWQALFVPDEDPLVFYKAIAGWCEALLKAGGRLYLEINEALSVETAAIFPGSTVFRDINSKPRFLEWVKL